MAEQCSYCKSSRQLEGAGHCCASSTVHANAAPTFHKIMTQSIVSTEYYPRLEIPASFANKYIVQELAKVCISSIEGGGENGTAAVVLQSGESGEKWVGKLKIVSSGSTQITAGWRAFSSAHKLEAGDLLVFKFISKWHFIIYTLSKQQHGAHFSQLRAAAISTHYRNHPLRQLCHGHIVQNTCKFSDHSTLHSGMGKSRNNCCIDFPCQCPMKNVHTHDPHCRCCFDNNIKLWEKYANNDDDGTPPQKILRKGCYGVPVKKILASKDPPFLLSPNWEARRTNSDVHELSVRGASACGRECSDLHIDVNSHLQPTARGKSDHTNSHLILSHESVFASSFGHHSNILNGACTAGTHHHLLIDSGNICSMHSFTVHEGNKTLTLHDDHANEFDFSSLRNSNNHYIPLSSRNSQSCLEVRSKARNLGSLPANRQNHYHLSKVVVRNTKHNSNNFNNHNDEDDFACSLGNDIPNAHVKSELEEEIKEDIFKYVPVENKELLHFAAGVNDNHQKNALLQHLHEERYTLVDRKNQLLHQFMRAWKVKEQTVTRSISSRKQMPPCAYNNDLIAAEYFAHMSSHPTMIKIMNKSEVRHGFWLGIPKDFVVKFRLAEVDMMGMLIDSDGKQWITRWIAHRNGFSAGWRKFSVDHELKVGDTCVFELINRHQMHFKVHIFRLSSSPKSAAAIAEYDTDADSTSIAHCSNSPFAVITAKKFPRMEDIIKQSGDIL